MSIPPKAKAELEKLLQGNQNFINCTPTRENMCLETLKRYAYHQAPHACVLACADSRVVPEIIFDCGIGELFVVRVAGITTGPNIIESIEFAVKNLKVPLVVLLGHDDCGVMKHANAQHPAEPREFKSLMKCVYPALDGLNYKIHEDEVAKKHTGLVKEILERSEIIRQAVDAGETYLARCHFSHLTGVVEVLEN